MNKANYDELIKKLNEFRMSSLEKTFTGVELNEALSALGFSTTMASAIAQKCFPYETMGKGRLYGIPKEPIHRGVLVALYDRQNKYSQKAYKQKKIPSKPEDKTQEAWDVLIAAGVIKPKFSLTKLKAEYPEVYLKCLDYEIVK